MKNSSFLIGIAIVMTVASFILPVMDMMGQPESRNLAEISFFCALAGLICETIEDKQ